MVNFFKNLFRGHHHDEMQQMQMQQMQQQMYMQQQAMMMHEQQMMFGMNPQPLMQQQYPAEQQYQQQYPVQQQFAQQQQQFQQQPGQPAPLLNHNLQIPPQQLADMQRAGGYVALGPDGNPMIWYPNGFPAPAAAAAAPQAYLPPAQLQQPQVYVQPQQQQQQYVAPQQQQQYAQPAAQQQPAQFYTPAGIAPNSITQQQIQRVGPHETLIRTQLAPPPQPVPAHPPKPTKFVTIKPDGTRITTTVTNGSASNSTSIAPPAVPSPQSFRNSASVPQLVSAPHPEIAQALPGRGPASFTAPPQHAPLDPVALQQQQFAQQQAANKAPVYDINAAAAYAAAATANGAISPSSSATPSRNVSPADGVAAAQYAQFNQSPPTLLRA